ncbi:MAG: phosphatidylserine decarboxylase [Verrucomicrobiales bacterium]|nr:phosphatidylserine decarboxylase [Verrucomicrobiales bacterium]
MPLGNRLQGLPKRIRDRLLLQEDLNFLLTNRVPRAFLTRAMGRFSRIRNPVLTRWSIGFWRLFSDLDLSEAREQEFASLQECFTRALRPGARSLDPDRSVLLSPCDGIVGACGPMEGTRVFQAKGYPYTVSELFGDATAAEPYRNGVFVTLRLTSAMYHRFHAPDDATVTRVNYLSGDTWNVNPIALKRVERLFCRNERAVVHLRLDSGPSLALVAVAAILVAGIRLHFLDVRPHLRFPGPREFPCATKVLRGQEMGWFEHGSTILVFAPEGFRMCAGLRTGDRVRMGQRLLALPEAD